jgi:hypothetical protein
VCCRQALAQILGGRRLAEYFAQMQLVVGNASALDRPKRSFDRGLH